MLAIYIYIYIWDKLFYTAYAMGNSCALVWFIKALHAWLHFPHVVYTMSCICRSTHMVCAKEFGGCMYIQRLHYKYGLWCTLYHYTLRCNILNTGVPESNTAAITNERPSSSATHYSHYASVCEDTEYQSVGPNDCKTHVYVIDSPKSGVDVYECVSDGEKGTIDADCTGCVYENPYSSVSIVL